MAQLEPYECVVLGGGNGGMFLAWHMARAGKRTAVIERQWIGGSCPNINCLPSKNMTFRNAGTETSVSVRGRLRITAAEGVREAAYFSPSRKRCRS